MPGPKKPANAPVAYPTEFALDDLDRNIILALRDNCQVANKDIAQKLGVAESTIASRLRAMHRSGAMRVMAQRDLRSLGYDFICFTDVHVSGRAVEDVAHDLARIDQIGSITLALGAPSIICQINARDRKDMLRLIEREIGRVKGVTLVESSIALEIVKYVSEYGSLEPHEPDDELDEQLIALLQADSRMSNREIGRHLGVSDGTIRQRMKRLKEEKIIRLGVVCNPVAVGFEAGAYVRIAVEPSAVRRVADALAAMNEVMFVALTMGGYDIIAFAVTRTRADLNRVIENKIATLGGVRSIDAREAMGYAKHRYDLVRIK